MLKSHFGFPTRPTNVHVCTGCLKKREKMKEKNFFFVIFSPNAIWQHIHSGDSFV
jgi:hypothetical protein